eukprot:1885687-Alexandrium_andersonii.AAC.1
MDVDRPSAAVRRGREALRKRLGPRSSAAADTDSAADRLVDNANVLGIRPPNIQERARAVGLGQSDRSLGLAGKQA